MERTQRRKYEGWEGQSFWVKKTFVATRCTEGQKDSGRRDKHEESQMGRRSGEEE